MTRPSRFRPLAAALVALCCASPAAGAPLVGLMNSDATHKALVVFNPATGAASQLGGLISAGAMNSGAAAMSIAALRLHFAAREPVSGEYRLFTVDLASGAVLAQPQITPLAGYEALPIWLAHDGTRLIGLVQKDATHKTLVEFNTASGAMTAIGTELTVGETWSGVAVVNPTTRVSYFAATDGTTTTPRLYRLSETGGVAGNPVITAPAGIDPAPVALLFDATSSTVAGLWRDTAQSRIVPGYFPTATSGAVSVLPSFEAWGDSSGVATLSTSASRLYFAADNPAASGQRLLGTANRSNGAIVSLVAISNANGLNNVPQWIGAYAAGVPGRVPDGTAGTSPLQLGKSGGNLALQWGTSCSAGATDYAVYEGTLGGWYSHAPIDCSSAGALATTVTPASGNRYYLVVPVAGATEGSYGTTSSGAEIPSATSRCYAPVDTTACGSTVRGAGNGN